MERKYYLRGLGIGIAVTAIIMGIALSGDDAMTDAEIIARAKELGMVENTVLANTNNEDAQESTDEQDAGGRAQDVAQTEQNEVQDGPAAVGGPETDDETDVDADSQAPGGSAEETDSDVETGGGVTEEGTDSQAEGGVPADVSESVTAATVKVITINSGEGSYTVARKLADVGVVTSAETFDTYLCANGYDKRLRTGTFSIPADASDEQIARIVTGLE